MYYLREGVKKDYTPEFYEKVNSKQSKIYDFGVPGIDILVTNIIEDELSVNFGIAEGSQTRPRKSVQSNFDDFEVRF